MIIIFLREGKIQIQNGGIFSRKFNNGERFRSGTIATQVARKFFYRLMREKREALRGDT